MRGRRLAERSGPDARGPLRFHVVEPVAVDAPRRATPDVLEILRQPVGREAGEEFGIPLRQGPGTEIDRDRFRFCVEIPLRYRRADLVFAAEEAADVPAVFAEQALGLVLRMSLEVDEEALLLLLDEAADAGVRRLRQDRVAAVREVLLPPLVPTGVRRAEGARQSV